MSPFPLPFLLLALFLSISLASPVALSSPSQDVLASEPRSSLSIPSSLYDEFDLLSSPSQDVLSEPLSSLSIPSSLYDEFVLYTRYSSAAYRYSNPLYRWLCPRPLGNTLIRTFKKGRTRGFITRDDNRNETVVAFRAKFRLNDFLSDLKFRKVPFNSTGIPKNITEQVRVNRGFLNAYNNVVNDVLAIIEEQLEDFPSHNIVVTGHSVGGAIAALAATSIKNSIQSAHPNVGLKLYTFGQPRVGTPEFARYIEETIGVENLYRAVHTRDVVPMVPKVNYEHFGTEYWQYRDHFPLITTRYKTVRKCDTNGHEDPHCSLSQWIKYQRDHRYYFNHVMYGSIIRYWYCL
ncbi:alpha/beta-hydrolase [Mycena polygramma]|nr:alpha/beta-hydrolase [Mycena polygramma]